MADPVETPARMADVTYTPGRGAMSPEPFIAFPLWGLKAALRDHVARCRACAIEQPTGCVDSWYAGMLREKIARCQT